MLWWFALRSLSFKFTFHSKKSCLFARHLQTTENQGNLSPPTFEIRVKILNQILTWVTYYWSTQTFCWTWGVKKSYLISDVTLLRAVKVTFSPLTLHAHWNAYNKPILVIMAPLGLLSQGVNNFFSDWYWIKIINKINEFTLTFRSYPDKCEVINLLNLWRMYTLMSNSIIIEWKNNFRELQFSWHHNYGIAPFPNSTVVWYE